MQVVAVTDPLELGFARQAMIGIRVHGSLAPVADALAALPEVDYVVVTAGSYDLLVEAVCESDEHLLELISEKIRNIDSVTSTETFMYLKLHKQTYSWGVR
jgi:Lrp/AsnC family transcriptional regulator for asnA, asnC and gidA